MKITLEVSNHYDLFEYARCHFLSVAPKVIEKLRNLPLGSRDFSYTKFTNGGVGALLFTKFHSSEEVKIRLYKSKWPWSKAIAYTDRSDGGNIIYFNSRKIIPGKTLHVDIAGTIAHEFCHEPCGFSHGSNTPSAIKDMSVPYAFGYLVSGRSSFPLSRYQ